MHFHQHQRCRPPIRSIASDQIGYGQRYLIDIQNAAIFGVNSLGGGTYLYAEALRHRRARLGALYKFYYAAVMLEALLAIS